MQDQQLLLDVLKEKLGDSKAKKLVKLVRDCDNYLLKFKKEIAPLLAEVNKDVKVGILFTEKEQINGNSI